MSHNGTGTPNTRRPPAQAPGSVTSAVLQLRPRWDVSSGTPSNWCLPSASAPDNFSSSSEHSYPAYPPALPPLSRNLWRSGYSTPELSPLSLSPGTDGVRLALTDELPPEILAEIFMHTLPLRMDDAKPNRRYEPLVISHVCRYWRDVAINLPTLWQRLSLAGCPSMHDYRSLELARLFADRTRGTGMLFEYSDYEATLLRWNGAHEFEHGLPITPTDQRCDCVLDFIISHIAEIRVLELTVVYASCRRLAALPPGAASALREISVQFLEGGAETQVLSHLFATSPRLVHFSRKSYMKICSIPLPVDVPWQQLVSAHIDDSPVPHTRFLEIMATGQSLMQLEITLCPDAAQSLRPLRTPIIQNRLENLYIYGDQPLDAVLQSLRLPSVRDVRLRSTASSTPVWPCNDSRILHRLVQDITGELDALEIFPATNLSEGVLISLLELPQAASLTWLKVRGPLIQDAFFTRLNPDYGPPLAPDLTTLIIGQCATTDGIVTSMMTSRRQNRHPLQDMHVFFGTKEYRRHPKDVAGFRALEEQGMDIWCRGIGYC